MKQNRYPGIYPFSVNEKKIFFGRDLDIERLYKQINVEQLIVLFSKSGLGKSSIINAGLVPLFKVKESYFPYSFQIRGFQEELTIMPLDYIKKEITTGKKIETFLDAFAEEPHSLWHILKNQQLITGNSDFVLIFDQFEELFNYPESAILNFKEELAEILNVRLPEKYLLKLENELPNKISIISNSELEQLYKPLNIKVLIAIRSDKISLMHSLKDMLPTILNKTCELLPLDESQAKEAIIMPAGLRDDLFITPPFKIENDAWLKIKEYLTKGGQDEIESFQLQAVCQHLEKMVSDQKTRIKESDLGDLSLVFKSLYDNLINSIESDNDKHKVRLLIEEGLIFEEDRRRLSLYEGQIHKSYAVQDNLLDKLINSHFIRRDVSPLGGYLYELAHDSLVDPVLESRSKRIQEE
jgi:hypothetical protein